MPLSRPALRGILAVVVVAAVAAAVLMLSGVLSGGCRDLNTQVASREIYQGDEPFPGAAEDWPRWRGPRGDGISRETGLADAWPEDGPPRLWAADVGVGYSSPVAAAGRVYLFSTNNKKESLACFDAHSGELIWNNEQNAAFSRDYPGTRATPTVENGRVYTYGRGGDLICRDLKNGEPSWQTNVLSETGATNIQWGMASSPLIVGDLIYVQSGKGGPAAVAVNKSSGEIIWQSEAQGGAYAHVIHITVDNTPQLVVFGGDAVWGMDPATGATHWTESWPTNYGVNAATPIYRDGHLFVSSEYGMGGMMLKLSSNGGTVSSERVWEKGDLQSKFPSPVLDGDLLFVNSRGKLTCLTWPTNQVRWVARGGMDLGIGGAFVRAGDKLIAMNSDRGLLSLIRATADGAELVSQAEIFEDPREIWSTPLIYGGRLYVKGEKELVCFDISDASSQDTTSKSATLAEAAPPADPDTEPAPAPLPDVNVPALLKAGGANWSSVPEGEPPAGGADYWIWPAEDVVYAPSDGGPNAMLSIKLNWRLRPGAQPAEKALYATITSAAAEPGASPYALRGNAAEFDDRAEGGVVEMRFAPWKPPAAGDVTLVANRPGSASPVSNVLRLKVGPPTAEGDGAAK